MWWSIYVVLCGLFAHNASTVTLQDIESGLHDFVQEKEKWSPAHTVNWLVNFQEPANLNVLRLLRTSWTDSR